MMNPKNERSLLIGSVIGNIFLVAFVAGRMSLTPPPPPHPGDHMPPPHHERGERPPGGPHGDALPPPQDGPRADTPPPPPGEGRPPEGGPQGDMRPPPPPGLFAPHELFSREEMQADFGRMKENFDKIRTLRESFAEQLKSGPVSKEDVLKHFSEVGQIMDGVRNQTQEKAAEKIAAMTPEERQQFAEKLTRKRP